MASSGSGTGDVGNGMTDIIEALKVIQENQAKIAAEFESFSHRLDILAPPAHSPTLNEKSSPENNLPGEAALPQAALATSSKESSSVKTQAEKAGFTSRIILT